MRIGVIVHYGSPGGPCIPAMITDAREIGGGEWEVRLTIFPADAHPTALPSWIRPRDCEHMIRGYHATTKCSR